MGCGKTTLAKKLAEKLNMELIDTDQEIVKAEGKPISEIFAQNGEEYFRNLETNLIKKLSAEQGRVISLGGGLAANPKNHPYLKEAGTVILLDCGIKTTLKRISGDKTRPLTAGGKQDIINRYNARKPVYELVADIVVNSAQSKAKTLNETLEKLSKKSSS